MTSYFCAGVALGILTEALAYALSLWWYRIAWMRIFNIVLVFGLLFGGVGWALQDQGLWLQMGAGAALGLVIEILNDRALKIWHFPGDPWAFLKGQRAVIGVGLSWAAVPLLIGWLELGFRN